MDVLRWLVILAGSCLAGRVSGPVKKWLQKDTQKLSLIFFTILVNFVFAIYIFFRIKIYKLISCLHIHFDIINLFYTALMTTSYVASWTNVDQVSKPQVLSSSIEHVVTNIATLLIGLSHNKDNAVLYW